MCTPGLRPARPRHGRRCTALCRAHADDARSGAAPARTGALLGDVAARAVGAGRVDAGGPPLSRRTRRCARPRCGGPRAGGGCRAAYPTRRHAAHRTPQPRGRERFALEPRLRSGDSACLRGAPGGRHRARRGPGGGRRAGDRRTDLADPQRVARADGGLALRAARHRQLRARARRPASGGGHAAAPATGRLRRRDRGRCCASATRGGPGEPPGGAHACRRGARRAGPRGGRAAR